MSSHPEGCARRNTVLKHNAVPSPAFRLGILVGLILLFSGACKSGTPVTATQAVLDSADQVLLGMSHYVTESGVLRARVRADTAYFFSNAQRAELRNVHVTFYDLTGRATSTLTSKEGTHHWRTGDMEARGNVIVVRDKDGATMKTEVMAYNQAKNEKITAKRPHGTGGQFVLPSQ